MVGKRGRRLDDVVALLEANFVEREMLIEKPARGVVVLYRELRAGKPVIRRGLLDQGQRLLDAIVAEIADADLERVRCERVRCDNTQSNRADQASDHGVSLAALLGWRTLVEA